MVDVVVDFDIENRGWDAMSVSDRKELVGTDIVIMQDKYEIDVTDGIKLLRDGTPTSIGGDNRHGVAVGGCDDRHHHKAIHNLAYRLNNNPLYDVWKGIVDEYNTEHANDIHYGPLDRCRMDCFESIDINEYRG